MESTSVYPPDHGRIQRPDEAVYDALRQVQEKLDLRNSELIAALRVALVWLESGVDQFGRKL